ncbi:MAG: hypothetical protein KBA51_01435 [Kiritimatiellae bacterium]|nr:hypothetical protein [Kiritimatiellia bacterium]
MKFHRVFFAYVAVLAMPAMVAIGAPVINYQGRMESGNSAYTGTGYFKFVLHDGTQGLWSNDGTAGMGPPVGHVNLGVHRGLFHTELGSADAGMEVLPPAIFHRPSLALRTWVSTNGVDFVELSPDVTLRPGSPANLNTGRMLIVDSGGCGDFESIQEAIDYAAEKDDGDVVYIFPGYFELTEPIRLPADKNVAIVGVLEEAVLIANPAGAAVVIGGGALKNVSLEGNPALTDAGVTTPCRLTLEACDLLGHSGDGAAMVLTSIAGVVVQATHVDMGHNSTGGGMMLGGTVELRIRDSTIGLLNGAQPAIQVDGAASLFLSESWVYGAPVALQLNNAAGLHSYRYNDLEGAVEIRNLQTGLELEWMNVHAPNPPAAAVLVEGGAGQANVLFRHCRLNGIGQPVVRLAAASGLNASAEFESCSVWSDGASSVYAVVLDNHADNDSENVRLTLRRTRVLAGSEDQAGAVESKNSTVYAFATEIMGHVGYGIRSTLGGEVELAGCTVEGGTAAVRVTGPGAGLSLADSAVYGGGSDSSGPGVWAEGGARVFLRNSEMNGEGPDPLLATGLRLESAADEAPWAVLIGSSVFGEGRGALVMGNSALRSTSTVFISEGDIPAELSTLASGSPVTQFHASTFMRLAAVAQPAVLLSGASAPSPYFANCQIEALGYTQCFGFNGPSSATIKMFNTELNTAIGAGVTVAPPAADLGNGNYIP